MILNKRPRYEGRLATCMYCERRLAEAEHQRHTTEAHLQLQFKCSKCEAHFALLSHLRDHLVTRHCMNSAHDISVEELAQIGAIAVPSDLRSLSCRLCQKLLLAQDRLALAAHIKHRHGLTVPKNVLKYECRVCFKDFMSTAQFVSIEEHACVLLFQHQRSNLKRVQVVLEECLYCHELIRPEHRASHRGKHWQLDFLCAKCPRAFAILEEMKEHLSWTQEDFFLDASQLLERGWLVMPKDLRSLTCPICQRLFLCQSKQVLIQHIAERHSSTTSSLNLNYKCRSCSKSTDIVAHSCSKSHVLNGSRADEGFLSVGNMKDMRRMVCRLCGVEVNANPFAVMLKHLESRHDKFQHSDVLDAYVKFGCGHCLDFSPSSVHLWDKHFSRDSRCSAMMSMQPTSKEDAIVEADDIRSITCKLCMTAFEKCGFDVIQDHLKTIHSVEEDSLTDHVNFGCLLCPNFSPVDLTSWKEHFFCRNTACIPSHIRAVEEAHIPDEDCETIDDDDCRRLSCRVCSFKATDFYVICRHLEESHDVDTSPVNLAFTDLFKFGCSLCPNFQPTVRKKWSRHFAPDFSACEGSTRVSVPTGECNRILFWCDACRETREDIERHFQGSNHRKSMMALEGHQVIVNCGECPLKFSTVANQQLHHKLAHITK